VSPIRLISPAALLLLGSLLHCANEPPPLIVSPVTSTVSQAAVPTTPGSRSATPPATPKRPAVTEYQGTKVSDDYAWLENSSDPEVKAWSSAQNTFTRSILDGLEARPAIKDRITKLLTASASYTELRFRGGACFVMKDLPPKQQPFLVTLKSPEDVASERVLVDPNAIDASGKTTIDWYLPSQSGKLVAVSLS
jgi:prolyl oligopeptidase